LLNGILQVTTKVEQYFYVTKFFTSIFKAQDAVF